MHVGDSAISARSPTNPLEGAAVAGGFWVWQGTCWAWQGTCTGAGQGEGAGGWRCGLQELHYEAAAAAPYAWSTAGSALGRTSQQALPTCTRSELSAPILAHSWPTQRLRSPRLLPPLLPPSLLLSLSPSRSARLKRIRFAPVPWGSMWHALPAAGCGGGGMGAEAALPPRYTGVDVPSSPWLSKLSPRAKEGVLTPAHCSACRGAAAAATPASTAALAAGICSSCASAERLPLVRQLRWQPAGSMWQLARHSAAMLLLVALLLVLLLQVVVVVVVLLLLLASPGTACTRSACCRG